MRSGSVLNTKFYTTGASKRHKFDFLVVVIPKREKFYGNALEKLVFCVLKAKNLLSFH